MTQVRWCHSRPPYPPRLQWQAELGKGPRTPGTFSPPGALFSPSLPAWLDRTIREAEQCSGDGPLPAPGTHPLLMQPLLPPFAGYQGTFHSIQNCFPYGDCYRTAEPTAGGDGLAGEAHGFNPLRPNGYHSLSAPLPATGKPHLHRLRSLTTSHGRALCWVLMRVLLRPGDGPKR